MKSYLEIVLNPVRIRIIQELSAKQSITANELCEKINDVSRTTLYRHINILLENNILSVISEKKVRGSLERTFILNIEEMSKINSLENASTNALGFLMHKCAIFQKYFDSDSSDPVKDKIFFGESIMMLNDQEFDQFLVDIRALFKNYNLEYAEGRKARNISIISSPCNKNEEMV